MFTRRSRRTLLWGLAALCLDAQAAPLSLQDAVLQAERESPQLQVAGSALAIAQQQALPAGALPDPKLIAGLDNFPVTGPERGLFDRDFMTMQRIGLMQEVPSGDKRRASIGQAQAAIALSEASREVVRQQVRRDAAAAWIGVWALEHRLALLDDFDHENQLFAATIGAQVTAGRAEPADGLAPAQEAARLADRRDVLRQDIAKARASLRRFVGAAADAPLDPQLPAFDTDPDTLRGHFAAHPEIRAVAAQAQRADADLAEAEARKSPDWSVEVGYQRRGGQFGDMVSLQFSFDLPIAAAERQDPLIAARRIAQSQVLAEREQMLREHASQLESDLAEFAALDRQRERAETIAVPLAQHKAELVLAGYRAGRVRLADVLAARLELLEQRQRVLELDGERLQVAARLHYAYGDLQP